MTKIPVGETVSEAYSFGFKRFLSVLGVSWFPYVVVIAACVGMVFLSIPDLVNQISHGQFDHIDQATITSYLPRLIGIFWFAWLLVFIAGCMVRVGLLRLALGQHPGAQFIFFSLGSEVWMMAGALFLAVIIVAFIGVLTAGATIAIWFAAGQIPVPAAMWCVRVGAIIFALCWFIYVDVRLQFFLPAVVVAEKHVGLGRSWTLGGGNFWRIVAVAIVVFVPVFIGASMVERAVTGPFMFQMGNLAQPDHLTSQEIATLLIRQFSVFGPVAVIITFIRTILLEGLMAGAIGSAYRAVTADGSSHS